MRFDTPNGASATAEGGMYCGNDLDIVFTMDVSTSMGRFFDRLEQSILTVDTAIQQLHLPSSPRYGLVVFVDDVKVANLGGPYPDLAALRADFTMWNQFTSGNTQVNDSSKTNTTNPENSLDALYEGATAFDWRPAASTDRIIIHTTDNTFWDGPVVQADGVMVQHGYAETVEALTSNQIRVFAFVATEDCSTIINGVCGGADVADGWFRPYQGMTAIPEATDGKAWEITDVYDGVVDLGQAIPEAVADKYCDPYPVG